MPMSPRLLRPIASGVNRDALDWRDRVVANSGSVSASTFQAVSKFCNDIDRAGIRDRFYRLNLFCGTGLNACLVPLYRGPSRTGTQYGNTTDTNNGPFVSADYNETGSNGGLNPNNTSSAKSLNTGFAIAGSGSPVTPDGHVSAWIQALPHTRRSVMGVRLDTAPAVQKLFERNETSTAWGGYGTSAVFQSVSVGSAPHHLMVQMTPTQSELLDNGSVISTGATSTAGTLARSLVVFATAFGTATSIIAYYTGTLGCYSTGLNFSASGAAAYYSALDRFMVALGRK